MTNLIENSSSPIRVGDIVRYKGWHYIVKTLLPGGEVILWLSGERNNGVSMPGARNGPYPKSGPVHLSDLTLVRHEIGMSGSPSDEFFTEEFAEEAELRSNPKQVYADTPIVVDIATSGLSMRLEMDRADAITLRDKLNAQLQKPYCGCMRCHEERSKTNV